MQLAFSLCRLRRERHLKLVAPVLKVSHIYIFKIASIPPFFFYQHVSRKDTDVKRERYLFFFCFYLCVIINFFLCVYLRFSIHLVFFLYAPGVLANCGDEAVQRRPTHDRRDAATTAEAMTSDMEVLLSKLSAVIDAMSSSIGVGVMKGTSSNSSGGGNTAAASHTLQRHSEILYDYQQEFRKTRNSITTLSEHAELMSGANGKKPLLSTCSSSTALDGSTMNANGSSGTSNNGVVVVSSSVATDNNNTGLDALYKERASISASSTGAETAIATGLSLKEDLDRQRAMFASMVERMETMSEGLPAVNRLIGQIKRKKKRDVLILGVVISTLLFITFSWKVIG